MLHTKTKEYQNTSRDPAYPCLRVGVGSGTIYLALNCDDAIVLVIGCKGTGHAVGQAVKMGCLATRPWYGEVTWSQTYE